MKTNLSLIAIAACVVCSLVHAAPPGTAFTYQGRLNEGGAPANGSYVFRFTVYDQAISGGTVGTNITISPVDVANGLFTVTLDFGGGVFTGANRWLGIEVHSNQVNLAFVPLTPRQPVPPTPYAIYAGSVDAAGISGVVPSALNAGYATNFSGPLLGDVIGTQAATLVSAVGGQSATNVASGVSAANAATSANTTNTIVKRDANGNLSAGSVTLNGALYLPFPAIIYAGTDTVMIAEGSYFAGHGAGRGAQPSGENTGFGDNVLSSLTTGYRNTAIGEEALLSNTSGSDNTASGFKALYSNTEGSANTAIGWEALENNTTGSANTAVGLGALSDNSSGGGANTAIGFQALAVNNGVVGDHNTAVGHLALQLNGGDASTAVGVEALQRNEGRFNTAIGLEALNGNTRGFNNTASGSFALRNNSMGDFNTANGLEALQNNTTGSYNTADGSEALSFNTSGNNNIALGHGAGGNLTSGSDNIYIGNDGVVAEGNTIRIGTQGNHSRTFIAGISGVTVASGVAVRVTSSGQLGVATSSARFKRDIRSMDDASDVLLALRPVTFRYKPELDPQALPQFGLLAEEVEKVDPDLVARDDKNQVYTVRYEAVNAMLLNEFLKQHRKGEEQNTEIQTLKERLEKLEQLMSQKNGGAR